MNCEVTSDLEQCPIPRKGEYDIIRSPFRGIGGRNEHRVQSNRRATIEKTLKTTTTERSELVGTIEKTLKTTTTERSELVGPIEKTLKTTTTERSELVGTIEKTLKTTTFCNELEAKYSTGAGLRGLSFELFFNHRQQTRSPEKKHLKRVKKTNKFELEYKTGLVFSLYQNAALVTNYGCFNINVEHWVSISQRIMSMRFHNMLFP